MESEREKARGFVERLNESPSQKEGKSATVVRATIFRKKPQ